MISIHHVALAVTDIEKAKTFYASLGFHSVKESDLTAPNLLLSKLTGLTSTGAKICLLGCNNAYLELFEFNQIVGNTEQNAIANKLGIRHFALQVDDIENSARNCVASGGTILGEHITVPNAASAIYCSDPFGNIIEFIKPAGTMPPVPCE